MKAMNLIKTAILGGLLMATCLGQAFEKDKPSSGSFGPEQSQEQLKNQQQFSGKMPVVGTVEDKVDNVQPVGSAGGSDDKSFASAETSKAKASLGQAEKAMREAKNPMSPLFILAMLVGVVLVATMAIKAYSDKVVPVPKHLK